MLKLIVSGLPPGAVDHGKAHADMPLGQLIGDIARFRPVVHHHPVVKFICQAKYGHHVIGAVGMVMHNALAVEDLHHRLQPKVAIRLLGRLVFSGNGLGIGVPFGFILLRLFEDPARQGCLFHARHWSLAARAVPFRIRPVGHLHAADGARDQHLLDGGPAQLHISRLAAHHIATAGHDVRRCDAARGRHADIRIRRIDGIECAQRWLNRAAALVCILRIGDSRVGIDADVRMGIDNAGHDNFAGSILTVAPGGISTLPCSPTATILPPLTTITPCSIGGDVIGRILAPSTTSTSSSRAVCEPAGVDRNAVPRHTAAIKTTFVFCMSTIQFSIAPRVYCHFTRFNKLHFLRMVHASCPELRLRISCPPRPRLASTVEPSSPSLPASALLPHCFPERSTLLPRKRSQTSPATSKDLPEDHARDDRCSRRARRNHYRARPETR